MKNNELIKRRIKALNQLGLFELKEKFFDLHGFQCGETTVRNLRKRLACRMQEICYGGVSDEDMATLEALADRDPLANLRNVASTRLNMVKGTCYIRVWKGREYEARSSGDGSFEYDGRKFKSLSAIAREITGTRWNGKLFFGVK
jgi:hypothetical protein